MEESERQQKTDEGITEKASCNNCKFYHYLRADAIVLCENELNRQEYHGGHYMQVVDDFCCSNFKHKQKGLKMIENGQETAISKTVYTMKKQSARMEWELNRLKTEKKLKHQSEIIKMQRCFDEILMWSRDQGLWLDFAESEQMFAIYAEEKGLFYYESSL